MADEIDQLFCDAESDLETDRFSRSAPFKKAFDLAEASGLAGKRNEAGYEALLWELAVTLDPDAGRFIPRTKFKLQDGSDTLQSYPDVDALRDQASSYFESAMMKTKNPIRQARYADFLWEKGRSKDGKRNHVAGKTAIHAYVRVADLKVGCLARITGGGREGIFSFQEFIDAVRRAVQLSLELNEPSVLPELAVILKRALVEVAQEEIPRWRMEVAEAVLQFPNPAQYFDLLDLDRFLAVGQVHFSGQRDGFHMERCFRYLRIRVLSLLKDEEAVRKLRLEDAESFVREAEWKKENYPNGAMVAATIYESAHRAYEVLGMRGPLDDLQRKIQDCHAATKWATFSHTIEIPKEHIEAFFEAHRKRKPDITPEEFLELIAIHPHLRPSWSIAMKQTEEQDIIAPLSARIPRGVVAHNGPVFRAHGEEENHDLRIREQFQRHYQVIGIHVSLYLAHLVEKEELSQDRFVAFLVDRPFLAPKAGFIRLALRHWYGGDHISFMTTLVPQVEEILRSMLDVLRVSRKVSKQQGVFYEAGLADILRRPRLRQVLGEDLALFFEMLYADPRGDNLRNEICHGLLAERGFTRLRSALVIHTLLILGTFAPKPESGAAEANNAPAKERTSE